MLDARVCIFDAAGAAYPAPPYSPDTRYPEYDGDDLNPAPNVVYAGVRELFRMLELDAGRFGAADWNPLGDLIPAGARVLIKPNLVRHYHPYGLDAAALVTHASLVRAVHDYARRAAGPGGRIVVADAPLQSCDFAQVLRLAGLDALERYYSARGINFAPLDLRLVRAVGAGRTRFGRVLVQESNPGDPLGYTEVDLGAASLHAGRPASGGSYRVTCYDPARMARHHGAGRHSYIVANTLLASDVVINLPKMKTHQKAGLTGALKNFVGVNGHKDCLPHHMRGAAGEGGDEYSRRSLLKRIDGWLEDRKEARGGVLLKKSVGLAHRMLFALHMREAENAYWGGSWHGNDTISRTTVDLNRVVLYAGEDGLLQTAPRRRVLSIVDGIVAGEGDGPLAPFPKPAGLLLAGFNAVAVDMAMARLMGFDHRLIPTLRHALERAHAFPLVAFARNEIQTLSNHPRWGGLCLEDAGFSLAFNPPSGWRGHIEL